MGHTCPTCIVPQGDPYVDRIRYKELQPEKKKGFYTSDFTKRDEFTNTIRTEQWREQLKVRHGMQQRRPAGEWGGEYLCKG